MNPGRPRAARTAAAAVATLAAAALACVSTDPRPALDAVAVDVAGRSGLEVGWARSEAERDAVRARVRDLLARPLTAGSAARIAVLSHPDLQARLAEVGIAQADLAQAARWPNPTLEASLRRPSRGGGENSEVGLAFGLVDGLLAPLRARVAEAELERVRLAAGQAVLDTAAAAQEAYYAYAGARELAARQETIRRLDAAAAEFAERLHAAGNLGELGLATARAAAARSRIAEAQARREALRLREALQRALGLPGEEIAWTAAAPLPELPALPAPGDLEARALRDRFDLAAGRKAVDAVGRALALRKKTRFVPVHLELGVSTERELEGTRLTGPTLALTLPLFDTGRASIARLEAEHERVRRQLEALAAAAGSEVREALAELAAAHEIAALAEESLVPAAARVRELTLAHYDAMLKGTFDVLLARQAEAEAERTTVEARRDAWIARIRLERAVGGSLGEATEPAPAAGPAHPAQPPPPVETPETHDHVHHEVH